MVLCGRRTLPTAQRCGRALLVRSCVHAGSHFDQRTPAPSDVFCLDGCDIRLLVFARGS